jgi:hypothetical protein
MDGKGPSIEGSENGRRLGNCIGEEEKEITLLGKGRGLRCKAGGGVGNGKRLRYNLKGNENCSFNR